MKRRKFLAMVSSTLATAPGHAREAFRGGIALLAFPMPGVAQPVVKRIAFLSAFPRADAEAIYRSLRQELERFGWVDGRNIALVEVRAAEGRNERLPGLATEIVALGPDIILVQSAPATRALMNATSTIPIVMIAVGDPVLYGMVRSYTEPGGNVTGSSYLVNESSRKALEMLKEIAPRTSSVGVFANPTNEGAEPALRDLREAARSLGLALHVLEVRSAADFEPAFAAGVRIRAESLLLFPEPLLRAQRFAVGEFAARQRLPLAIVGSPRYLDAGGLFTYGPAADQYPVLGARYVDRILRGANPAKLPIEQPSKFELGLNLKSAKALGLDVAASVIARADEVIR